MTLKSYPVDSASFLQHNSEVQGFAHHIQDGRLHAFFIALFLLLVRPGVRGTSVPSVVAKALVSIIVCCQQVYCPVVACFEGKTVCLSHRMRDWTGVCTLRGRV